MELGNFFQNTDDTGFSLMELLVSMAIIAGLAAISIPLYSQYMANSFEARVKTDLRHVAVAQEAYYTDNEVYKDCTEGNCASLLPGLNALSTGVTVEIVSTATGFTGTASHPRISVTCNWNSSSTGLTGCS